jgi:transposase
MMPGMDEDLELIRRSGGAQDLKRAAWERVLSRWRASGLKVSGFCRQHGLCPRRMYKWRKRLGASLGLPAATGGPRLLEVSCSGDRAGGVSAAVMEIELAWAVLRLPYEGSAGQLRMILQSLQEAAC